MRIKKEDDDGAETPLLEDGDNVVTIFNNSDSDTPDSRGARRTRSTTERIRGRNSVLVGARRTPSNLFKSSSHDADSHNESSDVAFTIVVNRQADDNDDDDEVEEGDKDNNRVEVDFVQEAVQDAIQEAVQDAVQEVVQDTVTDAVQEAVAAAFEENGRFDVRANFYTLIAITGVVLYWRGIWNSWDYFFGLSIWSEGASVVTGLIVMITMRYLQVPLVESLPGG
ncbi:hypothetical protein WJX77_004901 [Trebouxia sp. C0004]